MISDQTALPWELDEMLSAVSSQPDLAVLVEIAHPGSPPQSIGVISHPLNVNRDIDMSQPVKLLSNHLLFQARLSIDGDVLEITAATDTCHRAWLCNSLI